MSTAIPWETLLFSTANTIYILSYTVTNIVWLRLLTVVAAMITLPYFFFQQEPLWSALFWQSMFALINVIHLTIIHIRSRPIKLNKAENLMRALVFSTLPTDDLRKLLKISRIKMWQRGDKIISQGKKNIGLYLIIQGGCGVIKNGGQTAHLLPGQFVGEMSYLTEKTMSVDVVCSETTLIAYWNAIELNRLFATNTLLHKYFVSLLMTDLIGKLSGALSKTPPQLPVAYGCSAS